jgi:hypothetical protein
LRCRFCEFSRSRCEGGRQPIRMVGSVLQQVEVTDVSVQSLVMPQVTLTRPAGPSSSEASLTGGCLCGDIRFEADLPALKPHLCSCKMCQRHTGALSTAWLEFPRDAVRWVGPGSTPKQYRSSPWSSRAFCPNCGSTIGAIDDKPTVALALGAFDHPIGKALSPVAHSFKSSAPRWWPRVAVKLFGGDGG